MTAEDVLKQLHDHQAAVSTIVDRAEVLLRPEARIDAAALARARWELTRALAAYQMFKHRKIFDPAMRDGPAMRMRIATDMKERCIAADAAYRAHVLRWSTTDVAGQWTEYRSAANRVMRQLRTHLEEERRGGEMLLRPRSGAPRL